MDCRVAPPYGFDDDIVHDARRKPQESAASRVIALVRLSRPDERLVHEGGGVQNRVAAIAQLRPRDATQRRIICGVNAFRHRSLVKALATALQPKSEEGDGLVARFPG